MERMQKLLDEYKKYDYLNQESKRPLVKIFVSYIKPSFLFKSEILTPIHLGRAVEKENSKDGAISQEDIKWLHENCIGDDDFEGNISNVNRRVGFLTGTYWAWKNYEKLGNPEYFGSFGYRRLFTSNFLENLDSYDCIIPKMVDFSKTGPTIKDHVIKLQGEKTFNNMIRILNLVYPEEKELFNEYLKNKTSYLYEVYIMKKDLFFDFCEWIFPLMFEFLAIPTEQYGFFNNDLLEAKFVRQEEETRDAAYIMEILTGFYCHKMNINPNIKTRLNDLIYIKFKENEFSRNAAIAKLLRKNLSKK